MDQHRSRDLVAVAEVVLATAVVALDLFLPALVLAAMASLSLAVRRRPPAAIGLRRPERLRRLVLQMLGAAVALTTVHVVLLDPVLVHATGEQQDTSGFTDLQGDVALLLIYLLLGWTLAAVVEEVAFRGYLLTRTAEAAGGGRLAVWLAVALSSVLFGLIHTEQGLAGVAMATVDGAVFAVLRLTLGTLWAPVLAHGFVNTIGFVTFFLVGPVGPVW